MKERVQFCLEWEKRLRTWKGGQLGITELCRRFGISRQTGYGWIHRYRAANFDVKALANRSSRPHSSPLAIPEPIQDLIVAARKKHPTWGPRKLRAVLADQHPDRSFPSASTIGNVLKRRGYILGQRTRRRRAPLMTAPFAAALTPNAVWCIDFKGKFRTADGVWCTPFTVTDACSRFCIRCEIVQEANGGTVERILDSAFREFGLPAAIRSDNGPPFASQGVAGLTLLAVWLLKLGIRLERIQPGKPQQNGRHERFHRTLLEAIVPARANAKAQQRAFDLFRREYNEERPHEAIGQKPPISVYGRSSRIYPGYAVTVAHDPFNHLEEVQRDGSIRWRRRKLMISTALWGQKVELGPDDGPRWAVMWGAIDLGSIDESKPGAPFQPTARPRKEHYLALSGR